MNGGVTPDNSTTAPERPCTDHPIDVSSVSMSLLTLLLTCHCGNRRAFAPSPVSGARTPHPGAGRRSKHRPEPRLRRRSADLTGAAVQTSVMWPLVS
jgi:hypothetical protein